MRKIKKKIVIGVAVAIIGLSFLMQNNVRKSEVDLNMISNMAMASGEGNPDEMNPIIVPTGWIDWLGEIIGF